MNKKVFAAVGGAFVAGAVIGFGGGSVFWKKKYEKRADEEIADVKARLEKKQAETEREEQGEPEGQDAEEEQEDPEDQEEKRRREHAMYASLYSQDNPLEDDDYLYEDERQAIDGFRQTREHQKKRWRAPKLIPEEQAGEDGFDVTDLEFYIGDQQLAYDDGTIVDNMVDILGTELYRYQFNTNDEGCVVVRNYAYETDYRVTKVWSNYADCY